MPYEPSSFTGSLPVSQPLRQYQWQGVSFLVNSDGALLADEMGLGKTVQAITAMRLRLRAPEINRAIVVAPASLRRNWRDELSKWAPELVIRSLQGSHANRMAMYRLPVPVLVASYEQLRIDALSLTSRDFFDLVILDEAQRIKNPNSATALACRILPRGSTWALTGTPVENRPDDLRSIFGALVPGLLAHCATRREIHLAIHGRFLRRRKHEVLPELPPIILQDVPLALHTYQRVAYESAWLEGTSSLADSGSKNVHANMLAVITKLKLICNHELESGESVKLDYLRHVLESLCNADDKVIVFTQYVRTLQWIAERTRGLPVDQLHGGMTANDRHQAMERFRSKRGPRALFASYGAAGVGLNLQEASVVVLFDRWWNPAIENQAIERAHRFGRERPLHVIRLVVRETVEERILKILEQKRAMFREYIDDAPNAELRVLPDQLRRILDVPNVTEKT